jgi:hypothetical protein
MSGLKRGIRRKCTDVDRLGELRSSVGGIFSENENVKFYAFPQEIFVYLLEILGKSVPIK